MDYLGLLKMLLTPLWNTSHDFKIDFIVRVKIAMLATHDGMMALWLFLKMQEGKTGFTTSNYLSFSEKFKK